jgi:hypothetical protein
VDEKRKLRVTGLLMRPCVTVLASDGQALPIDADLVSDGTHGDGLRNNH